MFTVLAAPPRLRCRFRSYAVKKACSLSGAMDREPAGATNAHPRLAVARGPRRSRAAVFAIMAAALAVILTLVAVIAVLATRPEGTSNAAPAATPTPTATANPSVSAIYQRVRPSVVVV